jgi:hypothetical protein
MSHPIARWARVLGVVVLVFAPRAAAAGELQNVPDVAITAANVTDELVLRDGTRAYGKVQSVEGELVTFVTTAGAILRVQAAQIVSVRPVNGRVVAGEFRRADPNPTRLFFTPTGRSLNKGDVYAGVYEIVLPFVQVGLTDRLSFGGGTPLIFGDGSGHPFWVTPKFQVYDGASTQASVGVLHFLNVGDGNFGVAYGVVTRGSGDSAVTGGIGYAYDRSYNTTNGAALFMVGGEHRVSRGVKLLTENYVFEGGGIVTGGMRWMGERFSADLAVVMPVDGNDVIAFPMVNVVYSFAR